jgi:hypothetical protein
VKEAGEFAFNYFSIPRIYYCTFKTLNRNDLGSSCKSGGIVLSSDLVALFHSIFITNYGIWLSIFLNLEIRNFISLGIQRL